MAKLDTRYENQPPEEWLPVPLSVVSDPALVARYEVSNRGGIRRASGKPRTTTKNDRGYFVVTLTAHSHTRLFKVHRLVGAAFITNPDGKPEINHRNGDKSDNCADNLEWVTGKENVAHATVAKLVPSGDRHCFAILTAAAVRVIREQRAEGVKRKTLAEQYGVSINTIKAVLSRRNWRSVD